MRQHDKLNLQRNFIAMNQSLRVLRSQNSELKVSIKLVAIASKQEVIQGLFKMAFKSADKVVCLGEVHS